MQQLVGRFQGGSAGGFAAAPGPLGGTPTAARAQQGATRVTGFSGATTEAEFIRSQQERAGAQLNAFFRRIERDEENHSKNVKRIHSQRLADNAQLARMERQQLEQTAARTTRELGLPSRTQLSTASAQEARRNEQLAAQRRAKELADLRSDIQSRQRAQEAEGGFLGRFFGLPSRTQEAGLASRAARDQRRREEQEAGRLTREFGLPSRAQSGRPQDIDQLSRSVGQGLTGAFNKVAQAAQQLDLLVGVSIVGGLAAVVAEGFRLNAVMERTNITMAATLAISNDIVDVQGKLVEGPERVNFLLEGTRGLYDQIRKIAAETIVGQQELSQTVAENLALAQRAGFGLGTLGGKQTGRAISAIADVAQLAKALGLQGGQRQLTQEVRGLFQGERIENATIARLLGFSGSQIKALQARPGTRPGETAFVDEFERRIERARPILEAFKNSAQGIFEALISQAKLFLQVATESAFSVFLKSGRQLRDFLTDERIRENAQKIGEGIGKLARALVEVAQSQGAQVLLSLLKFIVVNADKIIAVLAAFKGLSLLQRLSAGAGGIPGRILGTIGGEAAGGAIGGAAAGAAAGGIRGRLAALGATRVGAASLLGAVGGAGATGIGAATGATGIGAAALGGGLIGTGFNFLTGTGQFTGSFIDPLARLVGAQSSGALQERTAQQLRQLREQRLAGEFGPRVTTLRDIRVAQLQRAERLRLQGREARRGELTPFERLQQGAFDIAPTPELTRRVTLRGLTPERFAEREKALREQDPKQLRVREDQERIERRRKEMLEAQLAVFQVSRNKEEEIKITARLDELAAVKNIADEKARATKILAIHRQRNRDIRELRENENLEAAQGLAEALHDEEASARIRATRERTEANRRIRDKRVLEQTFAAITLREQEATLTARARQFGERAGVQGRFAELRGRSIDKIKSDAAQELAAFGELGAARKISTQQFQQSIVLIERNAQEKIRKLQLDTYNRSVELTTQFTDLVRQSTRAQEDREEELLQFKERAADREKAINKARIQEQQAIVRAVRDEQAARQDLSNLTGKRRARAEVLGIAGEARPAGGFVTFSAQEEIRRRISSRFATSEEGQQLTGAQRADVVEQQTQEFLRAISDALTGPDGLAGVAAKLKEVGLSLGDVFTGEQIGRLQGIATRGGEQRETERVQGEASELTSAQERVVDSAQAVKDAQDARRQTEEENTKSEKEDAKEQRRAAEDFTSTQARLALAFSQTREDVRNFAIEAKRAGIALNEGITKIFEKALGVRVPSPAALAAVQAGEAVRRDQGAVQPKFGDVGKATVITEEAPGKKKAEGGTTINLNIGQLGADTRESIKAIGNQLERDARKIA